MSATAGQPQRSKKKGRKPLKPMPPERVSVVVTAIEEAYAALRDVWPELPDVAVTVFYDRRRRNRGFFWASQWVYREGHLPELHIDSTILREDPANILETLVHESVHGRAHTLGIRDTSREGRWHNGRFARLAREMGLAVVRDARIGHRTTEILPEWLAGNYARSLKVITEAAGKLWQGSGIDRGPDQPGPGDGDDHGDKKPVQRMLKAVCDCEEPRIIRVARSVFEQAPITCRACHQPFTLAQG